MADALPEIVYPVTLTEMLVPIAALAKTATGVPEIETLEISELTTPLKTGVPDNVASVVPSYVLSFAEIPVIVTDFAVILADKPVGCEIV